MAEYLFLVRIVLICCMGGESSMDQRSEHLIRRDFGLQNHNTQ